ncbi:M48 family metallopeptidase [Thiomicrorhabdus indica]|uniref:M48 metallopeptidase family protein n=1 Tax=Thiomicrorhabdus indica TaxID=2267253 RepID=UPI00102D8A9A|nr:M48 family metallopeptidase [Thiomicrorhabdus indica]
MHFSLLLEDEKTSVELPVRQGRRRKTIALKFESNRPVIEVPKHLRGTQIERLLSENLVWLRRAYRKWLMSNSPNSDSSTSDCLSEREYLDFGHHAGEVFCQQRNEKHPCTARNGYLSDIEFAGKKLPVELAVKKVQSEMMENGFECSLDSKQWRSFKTAFAKRWDSAKSTRSKSQEIENTQNVKPSEVIDLERFLLGCKQTLWPAVWKIKLECNRSVTPIVDLPKSDEWLIFVNNSLMEVKFSVYAELQNFSDSERFLQQVQTQETLKACLNWALNWILSCVFGELYKRCLTGYLQLNLPRFASAMNLDYCRFEVRSYKSRWGSCKSDASLQFNWRICQAEVSVIDSLIIHELAHLQHPNHSASFWSLVKRYDANFFASEQLFKTAGKRWIQFLNTAYR